MSRAFPIHNDTDHRRALEVIESLWDATAGTPEADLLDVMSTLVEVYEKRHHALPPADPLALISFKLKELAWTQRELGRHLGWGGGRVSEVLSGKRPLTLRMVHDLGRVLGLPAGLLVHEARADEPDHVWVRVTSARAARAMHLGLDAGNLEAVVGRLLDQALQPPSYTVSQVAGTGLIGVPATAADPVSPRPTFLCLSGGRAA